MGPRRSSKQLGQGPPGQGAASIWGRMPHFGNNYQQALECLAFPFANSWPERIQKEGRNGRSQEIVPSKILVAQDAELCSLRVLRLPSFPSNCTAYSSCPPLSMLVEELSKRCPTSFSSPTFLFTGTFSCFALLLFHTIILPYVLVLRRLSDHSASQLYSYF